MKVSRENVAPYARLTIGMVLLAGAVCLAVTFPHPSRIQYILMILLSVAGVVFCISVLGGKMEIRYKILSASGSLAALVVILYFILKLPETTSDSSLQNYTLFLKDSTNTSIEGLSGQLSLQIGNEQKQGSIHDGMVDFKQLPAQLADTGVILQIASKGWVFKETHATSMHYVFTHTAATLLLEPDKTFYLVQGIVVETGTSAAIPGVHIRLSGISLLTDSNGYFTFYLPVGKPEMEGYIDITKPGYSTGREKVSPGDSGVQTFKLTRQ